MQIQSVNPKFSFLSPLINKISKFTLLLFAWFMSVSMAHANIIPGISAGDAHTVALKSDGTVLAWGSNDSGQLGFSPLIAPNSLKPVKVDLGNNVISVSAGYKHTVALKSDGTVWAWGDNEYGQLGNGGAPADSFSPVQVPGLNNVSALVAGFGHTLALKSDGSVWGWGLNNIGQLGNGSTVNSSIPVPVGSFSSGVIAISGARGSHGMVLKSDGSVWTWGSNSNGQIGNNNNGTFVTSPYNVIAANAVAISASARTSMALTTDAKVLAWGDNEFAQCAIDPNPPIISPVPIIATPSEITDMAGATAISAGDFQSIALRSNGTVQAVGSTNYGQLGDNTTGEYSFTPVAVISLSQIFAISSGTNHSMAIKDDGSFYGWGLNSSGQLGIYNSDNRSIPASSPRNSLIAPQVSAGYKHAVALKNDGTVWAWGLNDNGQLGNNPGNSTVPVNISGLNGVVSVAAGYGHSTALKSDGTVWSWGANNRGQLGNASTLSSSLPVAANSLTGIKEIASSGGNHVLALKSNGTVWAWGADESGQLGNGAPSSDSTVPVQVTNLTGVTAIAASIGHSAALRSDGTVMAWGDNFYGQLGQSYETLPNSSVPVQISGLSGSIAVKTGDFNTFAVKEDGTLQGIGRNNAGQLGNASNTDTFSPATPSSITGFTAARMVSAGDLHTSAIDNLGAIWGWGANSTGQLGNGSTTDSNVPVQTASVSQATDVSAGFAHSIAAAIDGTVWGWGLNDSGQLGDGTIIQANSPVRSSGLSLNIYSPLTSAAPASGTFPSAQSVTLTSDGGQDIYYTVDGSTPTYPETGATQKYVTPVTISSTTELKFFGVDIAGNIEPMKSETYIIAVPPFTTAAPAGGTYSAAQSVTLSSDKPGVTYYTLDGTSPTYPETGSTLVYAGPITINANTTLNYFSVDANSIQEAVKSQTYTIETIPVTTATPAGGTYSTVQSVVLSSDKPGTIFYTVDGTTPTYPASGTTRIYSLPITISSNIVLKFFARDNDNHQEALRTETYTMNIPPETTAAPPGGTYNSAQAIELTANKPGTIYYTVDGSDPTYPPSGFTSTYVTPIIIDATTTLKYFTRDIDGNLEAVKSQVYTMLIPPVTVADPPGGTYSSGQTVTLTPNETGNVYYTLDGSDPTFPVTGTTQIYGGPITLTASTSIKYFARDLEGNNEAIQTQSYLILQRLTVEIIGGSGSSVNSTPAPDISCSGLCSQDYPSATIVQLTASPSATDNFTGWSGACSGTGICSVNMNAAASVTANFETKPVISVSATVAAGLYHTLALKNDGTLWGWGQNNLGQLGDGTTFNSNAPVPVDTTTGLQGVKAAAAGLHHSLALTPGGAVWAWGDNSYGQLGITGAQFISPVPVSGILDVKAVAAGEYHSLALKNDGTVWVWGRNNLGQLGTGDNTDQPAPVQVSGLTGITAIAAKGNFSLALKSTGEVLAWGHNLYGQLGNQTYDNSISPSAVSNLTGVKAISAGYNHSLALKYDGTVMAWGENATGGLGNGTDINSNTPVPVSSLNNALAISAGYRFSTALGSNGSIFTWGWNNWGQLGDSTNSDSWLPVQGTGITAVAAVASGYSHSVVMKNDGSIYTWGANVHGELGNSSNTDSNTPVQPSPTLNLGVSPPITTANPPGGAYTSVKTVTLTANEPSTIYYTLDGATPTNPVTGSTQTYSTPLTISSATTLKFFAVSGSSALTEPIRTETYTIDVIPVTTATPVGGTYTTVQSVTLSSNKPGSIYYTVDGTDPVYPVALSTQTYSAPISISSTSTLKYFARDTDGNQESIKSQLYTMNIPPVTSASPQGGTYSTSQNVVLTSNETSTIYFTIDGSDPSYPASGSTQTYSAPIGISSNTTIKFFGVDPDGNQEATHTEIYVMNIPPVTSASPTGGSYSSQQIITLTSNEPGSTIYYTIDGSNPSYPVSGATQIYNTAITVSSNTTLKFFGRDIDGNQEAIRTEIYTIYIPPATTATPPGGTYPPGQTVTLSSNKPGSIYFTTDGSTPTFPISGATQSYSSPIPVYANTTIKYFTRDLTGTQEAVQTQTYTISNLPYTTATPPGGSYTSIQTVTLSANKPATVYYTVDGSTPTFPVTGSTQIYLNPITLSQNTTLKYFAVDTSNNREGERVQTYVITLPVEYRLDVTVVGGNGSVVNSSPAPDMNCTGNCNQSYVIGTEVTLTAAYSPSDVFIGWSGACTGTSTCTVNMNSIQAVTATFAPIGAITTTPQMIAGEWHTLSLKGDGSVWAWGSNNYGQLGNDIFSASLAPRKIETLQGVTAIAAGNDYSLALRNDGTVWAWGSNNYGQLGDGTEIQSSKPVMVRNLSGVISIAAGAGHSIAVRNDGTVWAWGNNSYGQSGIDPAPQTPAPAVPEIHIPAQVSGITGATSVAAGWLHSLALLNDGTVMAWGRNTEWQLGNQIGSQSYTPSLVNTISGITAIAAGGYHSVALKNDTHVWSWGKNSEGQLGNNSNTQSSVPVEAFGLINITDIACGANYTIARNTLGDLMLWGNDAMDVHTSTSHPVPVYLGLTGISKFGTGYFHAVAMDSEGAMTSWGVNNAGQLGNGKNSVLYQSPAPVIGLNLSSTACLTKVDATCYGSIAEAYLSPPAAGAASVLAQTRTFNEPLNFNRDATVTINGGFDPSFTSTTGTTEVRGPSMSITSGSVAIGTNVTIVIAD